MEKIELRVGDVLEMDVLNAIPNLVGLPSSKGIRLRDPIRKRVIHCGVIDGNYQITNIEDEGTSYGQIK